uniref:Uncharacterized protein n=1 Tax=Coccidioides posadasii RMSCC 3488 TaxID=454284 RepID=A0A0J6FH83_COCPO|nr:hypothetical protein CPAG_08800 [Coccidioides posadasii RMSCC 3488]
MAEEARAGRSALAEEQPCRGGGGGRQRQQQQYQYQHEHEHEHEHRQSKLPARELVDQCEVQRQVVPPPPTEKMESREAADKTTQRHASLGTDKSVRLSNAAAPLRNGRPQAQYDTGISARGYASLSLSLSVRQGGFQFGQRRPEPPAPPVRPPRLSRLSNRERVTRRAHPDNPLIRHAALRESV